jgi:hypothetical protein
VGVCVGGGECAPPLPPPLLRLTAVMAGALRAACCVLKIDYHACWGLQVVALSSSPGEDGGVAIFLDQQRVSTKDLVLVCGGGGGARERERLCGHLCRAVAKRAFG